MNSNILFDPEQNLFTLRLRSSFYALRILADGQVVHVGSGPLPAGAPAAGVFLNVGNYEETSYVWETQGQRYELPTYGDISFHDTALKVTFPLPTSGLQPGEAANTPIRDLRLRYHSHCVRTDAAPALSPAHGQGPRRTEPRQTLCLRLKDAAYEFYVTLYYRLTVEHDILERWIELENRCGFDVPVQRLAFATVHLPNGGMDGYELTRTAGLWLREFLVVRQKLEQGRMVLDQQGLNTGHAINPFYLLSRCGRQQANEEAGTVFFGALAYSGNWRLCFETLSTSALRVHGGYELSDFSLTLAPGESHVTPAFVHGCCAEGWGGASRRLHRFARDYVLPGYKDGKFRPVLYNSWEATYFNLSLQNQMELARKAASIGVELFCVDDGWFGARRHDRAGLGDWTVSPEVFPGGSLKPLIDEVKRLGMKFGLWVEPEMVNPDSNLYRAHPDWVLHFAGRPRTEVRQQLVLDFGREEVVGYIYNALDALLKENTIDFFKWDMNRYATEPGSVAGPAIWRRHVEAVYGIMDRLRRSHPGLEIQSCSGGGGRIDLGILARTDQVWTSDNTDAFDRTLIEDGFSLAYPPRAMEAWVTPAPSGHASVDLRFDVAMRGALGIGTALDTLSQEELDSYRRKIAFYKKIRPVVQEGDLYRLSMTAQADGQKVSIWQSVLPDGSRCVYSAVVLWQLPGYYLPPIPLRGLVPEAVYAVTNEKSEDLGRYSGLQLMGLGLPGDAARGGLGGCFTRSRTLLLERV